LGEATGDTGKEEAIAKLDNYIELEHVFRYDYDAFEL
jgi:hypothetical protein